MLIDSHLICGCKYICPLRFSILAEKTSVLNTHLRAVERLAGNKVSLVCLFRTLVPNVIERNCFGTFRDVGSWNLPFWLDEIKQKLRITISFWLKALINSEGLMWSILASGNILAYESFIAESPSRAPHSFQGQSLSGRAPFLPFLRCLRSVTLLWICAI